MWNSSLLFRIEVIPIVAQDGLRTLIHNLSMDTFHIQLQLCHAANDQFIMYEHSTVKSSMIIVNEERQVSLSSMNTSLTPCHFE
ncbi:hypothetical protein I4U23_028784 [Adineta vaga]|nr:hypothetical protein I4U23_028784 [Adineta vaga]